MQAMAPTAHSSATRQGSIPEGLTNATAIGYNATVSSNNSLVLGDINNISVGIGISNPSDVLHVKGAGEHQVTIEAYALPVGLFFKEAGTDAARIQHHGSGSYLQIQDYTTGWFRNRARHQPGQCGHWYNRPYCQTLCKWYGQ